jgi:hypothetical protein
MNCSGPQVLRITAFWDRVFSRYRVVLLLTFAGSLVPALSAVRVTPMSVLRAA